MDDVEFKVRQEIAKNIRIYALETAAEKIDLEDGAALVKLAIVHSLVNVADFIESNKI